MLKIHVSLKWSEKQQKAYEVLGLALTSESCVVSFNPEKECTLWVDASNSAIGGALLQPDKNRHPKAVSCTSRDLLDIESKYSIIEKETLGNVWAVEKLYIYLVSEPFGVIVDQNPSKFIFKNHNRENLRFERWQMKLQQYQFKVI